MAKQTLEEAAQEQALQASRRRRVEKVRKAVARLELVENKLAHAEAGIPAMRREVTAIRETIVRALGGNDDEEEEQDGR